ncbi:MAG: 2-C-methyl-D-erythritol 4-phosphate cytidylyltransferase [Planctomycetota bacterium]
MLTAIVTAGGAGVRFGGEKILSPVRGEPLVFHTVRRIGRLAGVARVFLVLPPSRLPAIREEHGEALERLGVTDWIPGGTTRMESVGNGLAAAETGFVLVHDAVRPRFDVAAADRAVELARESGAAIVAVPARDTLKRVDGEHRIAGTVPREEVWHAETPQVMRREVLVEAYRRAEADGFVGTDEASLVERIGVPVSVVDGGPWNVKVTEREDLAVVTALLGGEGSR